MHAALAAIPWLHNPGISPDVSVAIIVFAFVAMVAFASRLPVIGPLIRVATWAAMLLVLGLLLQERGRFDPYLSRVVKLLRLDRQTVVGNAVRVPLSPDGHFWVRARIDGVERRLLIDSGATVTALSARTARAASLRVDDPIFPMELRTANGTIDARTATVRTLRMGDIVARDLPVVVSPAFGDTDVLGMNFLSQLKSWRVEDDTLIMLPHHPQKAPKVKADEGISDASVTEDR